MYDRIHECKRKLIKSDEGARRASHHHGSLTNNTTSLYNHAWPSYDRSPVFIHLGEFKHLNFPTALRGVSTFGSLPRIILTAIYAHGITKEQ